MNKNKYLYVAIICIALTVLLLLLIPSFVDYYITHNSKTYGKDLVIPNHNYLIEGRYNSSLLEVNGYSITIDRQLNNSWLYKECNHQKGDDVKYYGVFYRYASDKGLYNQSDNVIIFAIKRELC